MVAANGDGVCGGIFNRVEKCVENLGEKWGVECGEFRVEGFYGSIGEKKL